MPEELREGDGRFVDDSDNVIDADANRRKEISKAAQEYLKKLHPKPIVIAP
ncbi:MAG: hypothetical protein PHO90_02840 [Candidatus Pacebacteria bacterium]|nr:hypothetical protein [Candidatus Paceibacterota bacterium]